MEKINCWLFLFLSEDSSHGNFGGTTWKCVTWRGRGRSPLNICGYFNSCESCVWEEKLDIVNIKAKAIHCVFYRNWDLPKAAFIWFYNTVIFLYCKSWHCPIRANYFYGNNFIKYWPKTDELEKEKL